MHTHNIIWATDALQAFKSLPNLQKLTVFADLGTYMGYYKVTRGALMLVRIDLDHVPEHCDVDIHGELAGRSQRLKERALKGGRNTDWR